MSRRMTATRDRGGREVMGWLEGGYRTLIDALEQRIRALGGEVHAATTVERVEGTAAGARGAAAGGARATSCGAAAPPAGPPSDAWARQTSLVMMKSGER